MERNIPNVNNLEYFKRAYQHNAGFLNVIASSERLRERLIDLFPVRINVSCNDYVAPTLVAFTNNFSAGAPEFAQSRLGRICDQLTISQCGLLITPFGFTSGLLGHVAADQKILEETNNRDDFDSTCDGDLATCRVFAGIHIPVGSSDWIGDALFIVFDVSL